MRSTAARPGTPGAAPITHALTSSLASFAAGLDDIVVTGVLSKVATNPQVVERAPEKTAVDLEVGEACR
ncbi:MAG: hypothetical protein ACRDUV_07580 [Pseudonocardiaceae bacterium]